jgi:hypothetical protein
MTQQSYLIVSDSHIIVPDEYWRPILGEILREADLITAAQLQTVLQDKSIYQEQLLGEIIASRGWLKQETADFFADQWLNYLETPPQYRLGEYLKEAGLLNDQQIEDILAVQQKLSIKFGEAVILNGWLKPTTIEFFLKYLFPDKL